MRVPRRPLIARGSLLFAAPRPHRSLAHGCTTRVLTRSLPKMGRSLPNMVVGSYVNLVPVIAKSDTMTLQERDAFRRRLVLSAQTHIRQGA